MRIYAARKQYVDYYDDNPLSPEEEVIFDNEQIGLVIDDYDELTVTGFATPEAPLANVKKAIEIADEIKADETLWGVREWYERHRHDPDFKDHYWMMEY